MPTLKCLQECKALSLCPTCGGPKDPGWYRCAACGIKHRQWQRKKGGFTPQQLSGLGKPVVYPGEEI